MHTHIHVCMQPCTSMYTQCHRREGGGEQRRRGGWGMTLQDQWIRGSATGVSPFHLGPGKPVGLLDLVPCLSETPLAVWVLGAWGGKKRDQWGGTFQIQQIGGNAPSVSPSHSGPRSLLGSWTWSLALQGQRHSLAPPSLSLSPIPTPQGLFWPCVS